MLWRKWRTCTNLMTIAYIQCREKQLSIKGCPKRYSCDGLHCFCIVRPGRLGVFMCFGDSSLPTAFVYMKSWTKTHHTDRIVCFEMLIQWCLSLPLWLSSFFPRLRLWKLRFRFWLCKESDAGMAKANLGSFLSLVMVTFEIGSESCQNFLEILHETNRFVNRSHATLLRSDRSHCNFQFKSVETVDASFWGAQVSCKMIFAIQINAYNTCMIIWYIWPIWLIWHLDTPTVPSFDQYTLGTLGTLGNYLFTFALWLLITCTDIWLLHVMYIHKLYPTHMWYKHLPSILAASGSLTKLAFLQNLGLRECSPKQNWRHHPWSKGPGPATYESNCTLSRNPKVAGWCVNPVVISLSLGEPKMVWEANTRWNEKWEEWEDSRYFAHRHTLNRDRCNH